MLVMHNGVKKCAGFEGHDANNTPFVSALLCYKNAFNYKSK